MSLLNTTLALSIFPAFASGWVGDVTGAVWRIKNAFFPANLPGSCCVAQVQRNTHTRRNIVRAGMTLIQEFFIDVNQKIPTRMASRAGVTIHCEEARGQTWIAFAPFRRKKSPPE